MDVVLRRSLRGELGNFVQIEADEFVTNWWCPSFHLQGNFPRRRNRSDAHSTSTLPRWLHLKEQSNSKYSAQRGSFSLALSLSRLCWTLFHNHAVRQWWNAKVCIRSNMEIFQKYVNLNFANAAYKTINVNNIILKLIIFYVKHYILYIVTC